MIKEQANKQEPAVTSTAATRKLLLFEPHEVDELIIENASGKVVCRKVDDEWQIVEPVPVVASQGAVQTVLVNLARARVKPFLALGEEGQEEALQQYGLDPPQVKVSLQAQGRLLDTVLYGKKTPSKWYVYVKNASENSIGLVEFYRRTGVDKRFVDLRDKIALRFKPAQATQLRIESQQELIEVAKVVGEWQMRLPVEVRADPEAIEVLLRRLAAPVRSFIEDQPQSLLPYGLDPPLIRLDVIAEHHQVQSLWIGGEIEEGYYAKNTSSASVFTLDLDWIQRLGTAAFDLKYKKLLDFDRNAIDRVGLTFPDRSLLFVKDKDTWFAGSSEEAVNSFDVEALLFQIDRLKAVQFLSETGAGPEPYGFSPPRMSARLWVGDRTVGDLSVGNTAEDGVYAKSSGLKFVCRVDQGIVDRLMRISERLLGPE